jgi:integral membrane protein
MVTQERREEVAQLARLRVVSILEGCTLLLLVFVAVPLKHGAGISAGTHLMGPIHGLAFLTYIWMLIQTVSGGEWSRSETIRLIIAALVPFGAFFNERVFARRQAMLAASD